MSQANPFDYDSPSPPEQGRRATGPAVPVWAWLAIGGAFVLLMLCGGAVLVGYWALRLKAPAQAQLQGPATDRQGTGTDRKVPLGEPIATVNAVDLFQEFAKNELAADERYNGKTIRVSGSLLGAKKDAKGRYAAGFEVFAMTGLSPAAYARLSPKEKQWFREGHYPPNVLCYIDPDAQGQFAKLPAESNATIIGRCVGRRQDSEVPDGYVVVLEDCILSDR
jgi:hypothetical protein